MTPLSLPSHILDRIHEAGFRVCRPVDVGLSKPDWQPAEVGVEQPPTSDHQPT